MAAGFGARRCVIPARARRRRSSRCTCWGESRRRRCRSTGGCAGRTSGCLRRQTRRCLCSRRLTNGQGRRGSRSTAARGSDAPEQRWPSSPRSAGSPRTRRSRGSALVTIRAPSRHPGSAAGSEAPHPAGEGPRCVLSAIARPRCRPDIMPATKRQAARRGGALCRLPGGEGEHQGRARDHSVARSRRSCG